MYPYAQPPQKKAPILLWVGGCCAAPFALLLLLAILGSLIPHKHDKYCALALSQMVVMERVKAPSSARFASSLDSQIIQDGHGGFVVNSFVDCQNSYGVFSRLYFVCHLKPNGKEDYFDENGVAGWSLISFQIRE